MTRAHGPALLLVGNEEPVVRVLHDTPLGPHDSGYTVLLADAPPTPDDTPDDALHPACLACACNRWPHLQTALALARRHGAAEVDAEGRWRPDPDGG